VCPHGGTDHTAPVRIGAPLQNDQSLGAERERGAGDRAEIPRILDTVRGNHEVGLLADQLSEKATPLLDQQQDALIGRSRDDAVQNR
jgi:hypothetical protein